MAHIKDGRLELDKAKAERFAVLITGGDANHNGKADVTVEFVTDPPTNLADVRVGPVTADLPVEEALAVLNLGARALGVPGVPLAAVNQFIAALRAAMRAP